MYDILDTKVNNMWKENSKLMNLYYSSLVTKTRAFKMSKKKVLNLLKLMLHKLARLNLSPEAVFFLILLIKLIFNWDLNTDFLLKRSNILLKFNTIYLF